MKAFAFAAVLCAGVSVLSSLAVAAEESKCKPIKDVRAALPAHTIWSPATAEQFQFLRGVFAMHPKMPTMIPPGDGAAIISDPDDKNSIVIAFTEKKTVCFGLPLPREWLALIRSVRPGAVPPSAAPKDDADDTMTF